MSELQRITIDPEKCGGRPCIRNLRIRVADILGMLADGISPEDLLADFPYLEAGDVAASLRYAAQHCDHPVIRAA